MNGMNSPYQFDSDWDFDSAHIKTPQPRDTDKLSVYFGETLQLKLNSDRSLQKRSSTSSETAKVTCVSSESLQFIKHYVANDSKCIFDKYIYQSDENHKKSTSITNLVCLAFNDVAGVLSDINSQQTAILSTHGWSNGVHEWSFKILECDIYRQEVGIVSVSEIQNIRINENGIRESNCFQARAVYGCERASKSSYYASYNKDGKSRCYKDLSRINDTRWKKGEIITVCLDLDKYRIKYYKQGKKVRKTLSLEASKTYYPIIAFSGHFRCKLISFK